MFWREIVLLSFWFDTAWCVIIISFLFLQNKEILIKHINPDRITIQPGYLDHYVEISYDETQIEPETLERLASEGNATCRIINDIPCRSSNRIVKLTIEDERGSILRVLKAFSVSLMYYDQILLFIVNLYYYTNYYRQWILKSLI